MLHPIAPRLVTGRDHLQSIATPLLRVCTPAHRQRTPSFWRYTGSALDAQPPSAVVGHHAGAGVAESSSAGLSLPTGGGLQVACRRPQRGCISTSAGAASPVLRLQQQRWSGCWGCSYLRAPVGRRLHSCSCSIPCPITNPRTMGSRCWRRTHAQRGVRFWRTLRGVCAAVVARAGAFAVARRGRSLWE